jgi:hypothetical protein
MDSDDLSAGAEEEDAASNPKQDSILKKYLSLVLENIILQIDRHGMPNCYRNKSFVISAHDPIWALHDAAIHGFKPDQLYHRDVFLWLPSCLPGAPPFFKCDCGKNLVKNGMH